VPHWLIVVFFFCLTSFLWLFFFFHRWQCLNVCPLNRFIVVSLFNHHFCSGKFSLFVHRRRSVAAAQVNCCFSFFSLTFFIFSIRTAVLFDAATSSHHCSKYNHAHVVSLSLPHFFPAFLLFFTGWEHNVCQLG